MNFLVKEVVIDALSTHWMRVQVLWLHEEWGREEMCYRRTIGKKKRWAEEEIALVREHYETMSRERLMQLLPDRGWISIGVYARKILGMKRKQAENILSVGSENGAMPDRELSYEDIAFMQSQGIPFDARSTDWEVQY